MHFTLSKIHINIDFLLSIHNIYIYICGYKELVPFYWIKLVLNPTPFTMDTRSFDALHKNVQKDLKALAIQVHTKNLIQLDLYTFQKTPKISTYLYNIETKRKKIFFHHYSCNRSILTFDLFKVLETQCID